MCCIQLIILNNLEVNAMDYAYNFDDSELIDNEILLQIERRKTYDLSEDIEHLDFDDRVHYFKTLNESVLFNKEDMTVGDLKFWFPECGDSNDTGVNQKLISKNCLKILLVSLAELMFL